MFEVIQTAPPDSILGLNDAFQRDTRQQKINLSVGVYKDAAGRTPILKSVKEAERRLLERETTKTYLPIEGSGEFRDLTRNLVLGGIVSSDRVENLQSPGGTGGLRILADFLAKHLPHSRVWVSVPTWDNHTSLFGGAGLQVESYPYLSADKTTLDFNRMINTLSEETKTGDVVLLHACCHNPTGVDPAESQWETIARIMGERGLLPVVDFAYQGFGVDLDADRRGIEILAQHCPEMLIASSFSKNFGLYSERVGAVSVVAADQEAAQAVFSQLKRCIRTNYSNPPRHGGSIVQTVLADAALQSEWRNEVTEMRKRIAAMRKDFVDQMASRQSKRDFSFLLRQKGMFSFSGLTPLQVDRLRSEFGVYIVGSGRINVAGITAENIQLLCDAITAVL
jgi:aspartate/tyrosine/aromatic aminotransferase